MGFQEILQEHDRRQARRFPKAPLPEGVDEGDIEDFTALETWQAGGKARRTHGHPCAGTFKTGDGDRNRYPSRRRRRFQKASEFASEDKLEPRPGAAGKHSEYL